MEMRGNEALQRKPVLVPIFINKHCFELNKLLCAGCLPKLLILKLFIARIWTMQTIFFIKKGNWKERLCLKPESHLGNSSFYKNLTFFASFYRKNFYRNRIFLSCRRQATKPPGILIFKSIFRQAGAEHLPSVRDGICLLTKELKLLCGFWHGFATYIEHGLLPQTATAWTPIERFFGHFGKFHMHHSNQRVVYVRPDSVNGSKSGMRWCSGFNSPKG